MKLSFVIPCYNSSRNIAEVVDEIIMISKSKKYRYEIILVNDGSKDGTFDVIKSLCLRNANIKGINLSKNFGQHAAQMAGFSYVSGDIVVSVDDDGQSPVNELDKLIDKMHQGSDVVYARYVSRKQTLFRNFGSWLNYKMAEVLTDKPKGLQTSSFYVMKRYVVDEIIKYKNAYPYIGGLLFRTTQNISNVDVSHRTRLTGRSNYTLKKMILLWLNGFTAFSIIPLRISSVLGIIFATFGFIYGSYIIIRRVLDPGYILSGWSSMMAVQIFVGGMILMMLGMIGEYIGRIYISINNSPQYVINNYLNINSNKQKK